MPDVDPLAIGAATLAAFALSGAYYAVLGQRLTRVSGAGDEPPSAWTIPAELLRSLVLVTVVAGVAAQGDVDDLGPALLLGVTLWVGFPVVLWAGAVIHERTPLELAAIHAGDWLVKLPVVAAVVSLWE